VCQGRRVEGSARRCLKICHTKAAHRCIHLEPNSKHEISHINEALRQNGKLIEASHIIVLATVNMLSMSTSIGT
jgi:hypothetical protein